MENKLPSANLYLAKDNGTVKVHSMVSPASVFANATHIIELPNELILVDGQFLAQYGNQFREIADSLKKPITRYYITHDHPDHYLGMGDAFGDVTIYALPGIQKAIVANAKKELAAKQNAMGAMIAKKVLVPTQTVEPGEEIIDGVRFIFERVVNAESPESLVIKLPEAQVAIVQDVLYHDTHAFVTGSLADWKSALTGYRNDENYDTYLPGHGKPAEKSDIDNALAYFDKIEAIQATAQTGEEFKAAVLKAYPNYAGASLIDIYLPFLYPAKN